MGDQWTGSKDPYSINWKGPCERACNSTPTIGLCKALRNRFITTCQIWGSSAQPFLRYRNGVCTCARAGAFHPWHVDAPHPCWRLSIHIPKLGVIDQAIAKIQQWGTHVRTCRGTHDMWTPLSNWRLSIHIPNLGVIGRAIPKIQEWGTHVHTCSGTPSVTCGPPPPSWWVSIHIPNLGVMGSAIPMIPKWGAHVQMHTIRNYYKPLKWWSSRRIPNLNRIGQAVAEI